jgi:hypothetical protein
MINGETDVLDENGLYIANNWQLVAQTEEYASGELALAKSFYETVEYTYLGTIPLYSDEAGRQWIVCYVPKLGVWANQRQQKIYTRVLNDINEAEFSYSVDIALDECEPFERETLDDLVQKVYRLTDDALCDGCYLAQLESELDATQKDIDELCFHLRQLNSK